MQLFSADSIVFSKKNFKTAQKQISCTTKSSLMQDWVFRLGVAPWFGLEDDVPFR